MPSVSLQSRALRRAILVAFFLCVGHSASVAQVPLQSIFDSLGPTVQQLETSEGRQIHFIDDGKPGARPVVFTGGLGTSVRVIRLLDFLRTMRLELGLRFITVERNGFGQTEFDANLNMSDYVDDVNAVLNHLAIDSFALFGISGGGPYTAKIAEQLSDRVLSIHMAATSPSIGNPSRCNSGAPSPYGEMLRYPMQFFGFPQQSPLHRIEGFQDTAFDEAARAHNLRGQTADVAPLLHELSLYCSEATMDSAHLTAPVYVYLGLQDEVLGDVDPGAWVAAYPNSEVTVRSYADGGHDVQYRHLDQILLDLAGLGDQLLVCRDGVNTLQSPTAVSASDSLGLCAWEQ